MAGFEDFAASPAFQFGYPLASALIAAAFPNRGARAVNALNTGLAVGNAYSQQQKRDEQDALLRQKLGDIANLKTETPTSQILAPNADKLAYSMPPQPPPQEVAGPEQPVSPHANYPTVTPQATTSKPVFNPQQQSLISALAQANRPDIALPMLTSQIFKQPAQPHTFGNAELGMYRLNDQGQPVELVKGLGKNEPTPPRPVFAEQGGEGVQSVYNPQTKQWETQRIPLTAAPPKQLSPEEQRLMDLRAGLLQAQTGSANASAQNSRASAAQHGAQTGMINQRTADLKKASDAINDPKTDKSKLTTIYSNLLRRNDQFVKADPDPGSEDFMDWQNVKRLLRSAETRLDKEGGLGGGLPSPVAGPTSTASNDPNDPLGIRKKK